MMAFQMARADELTVSWPSVVELLSWWTKNVFEMGLHKTFCGGFTNVIVISWVVWIKPLQAISARLSQQKNRSRIYLLRLGGGINFHRSPVTRWFQIHLGSHRGTRSAFGTWVSWIASGLVDCWCHDWPFPPPFLFGRRQSSLHRGDMVCRWGWFRGRNHLCSFHTA